MMAFLEEDHAAIDEQMNQPGMARLAEIKHVLREADAKKAKARRAALEATNDTP